jgi:hypothetical protein
MRAATQLPVNLSNGIADGSHLARIPMAWHEQPMIDAMKSARISWWRSV